MAFARVILLLTILKRVQSASGEHEYEKTTLVKIDLGANKTYSPDRPRSLEVLSHEMADRYIDIITGGASVVSHNDEIEMERDWDSEDSGLEKIERRRQTKSTLRRRSARHLRSPLSKRRVRTRRRRLRRLNRQGVLSHVAHAQRKPRADAVDQWEEEATVYSEEESAE